jgi:antitoxin HicB
MTSLTRTQSPEWPPYPVRLIPDEDGGYVIRARDVEGMITQGDDVAEALHQAADALAVALEGYQVEGRPLPVPTPLKRGEYLVEPRFHGAAVSAAE